MTQFNVQFCKDFRAFFSHLNAYIVIGCYCFLSFASALYLGNYFLRETDVINAYLSFQPFVLMLLIPALTMRLWSDETKTGTIELLLTLPVRYTTLVLAKFCAAFAFFNLFILCSIPLLIITSFLSVVDYGAIFLGYCGLWLCGLFFTALGCTISSCHRSNILCYLSTILIIFIVIELKFSPLTIHHTVFSLDYLNFSFNYGAFLSGFFCWGNVFYFLLATSLCLWLNVVLISFQRCRVTYFRVKLALFFLLLLGIFLSAVMGLGYSFTHPIDVTHEKKYTLSEQSNAFLDQNEQRIDITLYESADKREDNHSGYAIYAEYVEHFLNLLEEVSHGSVRTEIVHVKPFSNQERNLIRRSIPYTEDSFGHKIFMVADFTDNDGHFATINAFSPLRQNLLEADIMRVLRRFTLPKKQIAVIAADDDLQEMNGLKNCLNEFYLPTYLQREVAFIPPTYDAVIVINPTELSDEFLLALDQYIINGGNLLIFHDNDSSTSENSLILQKFVSNYGIEPLYEKQLTYEEKNQNYTFGPAYPTKDFPSSNIRSVLLNNAYPIKIFSDLSSSYQVFPLLKFNNEIVATRSFGRFVSDYVHLSVTEDAIESISLKDGALYFFSDTDILYDYLYLTEETRQAGFYENIPTADNLLFILRLLDYSLSENVESTISYKHSYSEISNIGQSVFKSIKERQHGKIEALEKLIEKLKHQQDQLKTTIISQRHASVKKLNDGYTINQSIEEAQDKLGQIYTEIFSEYELFITSLSLFLIFIIPVFLLLLLALFLFIYKKRKFYRIRRLIDHD